jgi:hypothetical protein
MNGNKMMWSRPDWLLPPFAPWLGVAQALMLVALQENQALPCSISLP